METNNFSIERHIRTQCLFRDCSRCGRQGYEARNGIVIVGGVAYRPDDPFFVPLSRGDGPTIPKDQVVCGPCWVAEDNKRSAAEEERRFFRAVQFSDYVPDTSAYVDGVGKLPWRRKRRMW